MKVKKYQAPSMPDAMKKVKKELGPDAVILNSKVVKVGGFLGMFKKNQTEVIAAIDPSAKEPKQKQKSTEPIKPATPPSSSSVSPSLNKDNHEVMKELKQLRSMIQGQGREPVYSPPFQQVYDHLNKQEIDIDLAKELTDEIQENHVRHERSLSNSMINQSVVEVLRNKLDNLSFGGSSFSKPFIHLVGPTGVGKTTTIAKLAANAVLNQHLKVAFITTDTYRIAAIDQLKTYAKLLDIPLEVAYSLDDYMEARHKFRDYDLVLIDTAGRNFRDANYVEELNKLVDFNDDTETYLVLSLTSKYQDMKEIYDQFDKVPIHQLIFTKVDETSRIGGAMNLALQCNIGIAYLTHGQNVPDDIVEASPDRLVENIVEDLYDE